MNVTFEDDKIAVDVSFKSKKNHWLISVINKKNSKIMQTKEFNNVNEAFEWANKFKEERKNDKL